MQLHAFSAQQIQHSNLPGPSFIIRMADSIDQLIPIKDVDNAISVLDLVFNDANETFGLVRSPNEGDAGRILEFAKQCTTLHLVAQCQQGIGRSQAVIAGICKVLQGDPSPIFQQGTYNIKLYNLILETAGLNKAPLPLVSLAIRVKYAADRLQLFLLSMMRQRHTAWEVVAVTDGPNPFVKSLVDEMYDSRIRLIETPRALGRWGHPYRQLGLDACSGEYIGMSNDDNYYVPGYLEQMLFAMEREQADLALCSALHSYSAWNIAPAGTDLGAWIAKRDLLEKTPWQGVEFDSDQVHIAMLKKNSKKTVVIDKPLFVHN